MAHASDWTLDHFPQLISGVGKRNEAGCIMQVCDYLFRKQWTDAPPCVHPIIRHYAIAVNDKVSDAERQRLVPLIPRLMNTNTGDERLTRQLLGHLARQVYPIYEAWRSKANYDDDGAVLRCIEAAERGEAAEAAWAAEAARAAWAAEAARAAWAAWAAGAAGAAGAAEAAWAAGAADYDLVALLVGLLDRYDALTDRQDLYEPTAEELAQVAAVFA